MPSSDHFNYFPDGLPRRLLELDDIALLEELERPTLVRFPGTGDLPPRAVATLLHGDEDTGYRAVLRLVRRRRRYPFDLYVVVGNVVAALADGGFRHRYLDDQEDFNRIWGVPPTTRLRLAAQGILHRLRGVPLTALVDVHNNSGTNPFYAIVPSLRPASINLATHFATTLLHWELGVATLMESLGDLCPAVAIECGLPGRRDSLAFAVDGLRRFLAAGSFPDDRIRCDYDLYGDLRKVVVRPEVRFTFGAALDGDRFDFVVQQDADAYNFRVVHSGHVVGRVPAEEALPLQVWGPQGQDLTEKYLAVEDGRVVLTREVTPVMMTRTEEAARKDCLFYVATPRHPPPYAP